MISVPDRQRAVELIDEATAAGARRFQACAELRISERTARRWMVEGVVRVDQRPGALRPTPRNKLSDQERQAVLDVCHSEEFASLPPSQIVPRLADQGRYLASESSFYRVLRAEGQQHHRGRAKSPVPRKPPASYRATGPCQVWTWDITWLPGPIAGMFFYLYLIVDIFSRKIVGWEVYGRESAEYASIVVRRAVWSENCLTSPLVLHADNGSPMKGATLKVTLEHLGVTASYSRPRVSNDNPFSEALFWTCKYRRFVQVSFSTDMLQWYLRRELTFSTATEPWKSNAKRPLDAGRALNWTKRMSPEEFALFEAVDGKQMRRLHYDITSRDGIGYGKLVANAFLQLPGCVVAAMTRDSVQ